jgi:serine/threonine-protein kinase
MAVASSPGPRVPFERLGDYDVLAPIAEGGMASVWLGRARTDPARLVALKVIRPEHGRNRDFVTMLLDEARIASRLSHPNLVATVGYGHDGTRHFLAMEALRGHTLLEVWDAAKARGVRIPREVVAWIGARIADGLHHAHEVRDDAGKPALVVHRDVNPANVFVTRGGVPKLIDFGLAKARDRLTSTAVGIIKGKLAYLAPEQAHGDPIDRRVDVFALGVTLWELALDRRLFKQADDVETLRRVREACAPDPTAIDPDFPPAFAHVLIRALAREPDERFATAGDLRDALDAYLTSAAAAVGPARVAELLRELFEGTPRPGWERVADEGALDPPASGPGPAVAPPDRETPGARRARLDGAIAARLERSGARAEPLVVARLHLERAIVDEALGDGARAANHARASLAAWPTGAAHGILRRALSSHEVAAKLAHLDAEVAAAASDVVRADLLAERARLVAASGAGDDTVCAAWERALDVRPDLPAALHALDDVLARRGPGHAERLAAHRARFADACMTDASLAAWWHVERAAALDDAGRPDAAKGALLRALELDPRPTGFVHSACEAHAVVHRDGEWLVTLLGGRAAAEAAPARAAALALDAACVARFALGDGDRAIALLDLAAADAPAGSLVARRVADELTAAHEAAGQLREALRTRRVRLAYAGRGLGRAYELRAIASIEDALGDARGAVASLEAAVEASPDDLELAEALDARLEALGEHSARADLASRLAPRARAPERRAAILMRAATASESAGDVARATELARAALVALPGSREAMDALLRLLRAPLPEPIAIAARARIAVHAHAADHAGDRAQRAAHLFAVGVLEEDALDDPRLAMTTYEAVLRAEPTHAGALAGLARTASRCGDASRRAAALLAAATASRDEDAADDLRVEAAGVLAPADADRALALVDDVLARRPERLDALRTVQRMHEAAGRWALVDVTLGARIVASEAGTARADLWLARAEVQRVRLRAPRDAIASIRQAVAIAPEHAGARAALLDCIEWTGDAAAQIEALDDVARATGDALERALALSRAADIAEHRLCDDRLAAALHARAFASQPSDPWLEERALRTLRRVAADGDPRPLAKALEARLAGTPGDSVDAVELARARLASGDAPGARSVAEAIVSGHGVAPAALRLFHRAALAADEPAARVRALEAQARGFTAPAARVGALWALAGVLERSGDAEAWRNAVARLAADAPDDRAAADALLSAFWPAVRTGDVASRALLLGALALRARQAADHTERAWALLCSALTRSDDDGAASLEALREALRADGASVLASLETARLGAVLHDPDACVAAALAQAEVAPDGRSRAGLLTQAAGQILSTSDARFGTRTERRVRAAALLEQALACDPEAIAAVSLLCAVHAENQGRERLLATLRHAFDRARSPHVVGTLGLELARVASQPPADRVLAIGVLRRVLALEPEHPPTLRALADQYLAQGAHAEAVGMLEAFARHARDRGARIAALLELADLHSQVHGGKDDEARALRAALDVDPTRAPVLRRLLALRRGAGAAAPEIAALLAQLAEAETAPESKAEALVALADLRRALGDAGGAELALVEACAQRATGPRLAALASLYEGHPAAHARSLAAVVARSRAIGRLDPAPHAALGRIEGAVLGRWAAAVDPLRVSLALDPGAHDVRAAFAEALAKTGSPGEAAECLLAMISPDPAPLLALIDPGAALATLELALGAHGRPEEAVVARELRALAGSLEDAAHVELRGRRLALETADTSVRAAAPLEASILRQHVVPEDAPAVCFDLVAGVVGAERKLAALGLDDLGADARDRIPPTSGQRIVGLAQRIAAALGVARPEIVTVASLAAPRVVAAPDALWIAVPQALLAHPEPVQTAAIARPLARIALGVAWLDGPHGLDAVAQCALLHAIGRQALPGYGADDTEVRALVDDAARRVARALGRAQKRLLAAIAPTLATRPAPTVAEVDSFRRAVAAAEARTAFLVTGDTLATLDALRASDGDLADATASVGPSALRAALVHPLAGDMARFALTPQATALRWRAGTLSSARRA